MEETDHQGKATGRIEYNPLFSKTGQGGTKKLADSKWLIPRVINPDMCSVRFLKKLLSKRSHQIKTNRLFLATNQNWKLAYSKGWYKNCRFRHNTIYSWFKSAASSIGIDTKKVKITNHSAKATAISYLAKAGDPEQQLIEITRHGNNQSIKPYLQIDSDHQVKLMYN